MDRVKYKGMSENSELIPNLFIIGLGSMNSCPTYQPSRAFICQQYILNNEKEKAPREKETYNWIFK